MIKPGKMYGVGVGPGDPELLTMKAVRIIREAEVIAVPKIGGPKIIALEIVKAVVDVSGKEIIELYMPMTRDEGALKSSHEKAAGQLSSILAAGKTIAFLTLGDPSIYSTYVYLHKLILQAGFEARLIAGVPSFCAVAARLNDSLCAGGEPLHIIPASYKDTEEYLDWKGTKVLMKSGRALETVINALQKRDLLENTIIVERCGMDGEKVFAGPAVVDVQGSYFSTIVVKDKENKR